MRLGEGCSIVVHLPVFKCSVRCPSFPPNKSAELLSISVTQASAYRYFLQTTWRQFDDDLTQSLTGKCLSLNIFSHSERQKLYVDSPWMASKPSVSQIFRVPCMLLRPLDHQTLPGDFAHTSTSITLWTHHCLFRSCNVLLYVAELLPLSSV